MTATQQGARAGSSRMDFWSVGRTLAKRRLWRDLKERRCVVQTCQQNDTRIGKENSGARHKLPIDGKCSKVKWKLIQKKIFFYKTKY